MPKKAKELSALAVSKLRADGKYAVGGADGLHLRVVGRSKTWILRVAVGNKLDASGKMVSHRRDISLGSYPEVSLAEARDKAYLIRKQIQAGIDPVAERQAVKKQSLLSAAKLKTFEECAHSYIEANRAGWKNDKHAQQWHNTLATYAFPIIGRLSVVDVDTGAVLAVLQQPVDDNSGSLWHAKSETASRLRGRVESILDWATFRGFRTGDNPARWKGHLEHELPSRSKLQKVEHHAALPYAQIPAFMAMLRNRVGISARALEFAVLTAARSSEVRGATWDEIDFNNRLWIIPAGRMKAGREHRVPLADATVSLLKSLPRFEGSPTVFPAARGGQLSDTAMIAVLKRMARGDLTQHGFRSTFRDWAGETTTYPREVCEHALAHKLADGVEAAYQRGDLLLKRVGLMEDWARYCEC